MANLDEKAKYLEPSSGYVDSDNSLSNWQAFGDDAEGGVLMGMMLDGNLAGIATRALKPSHFLVQSRQWFFRAMCDLYERGEPIDPVTIKQSLLRLGNVVLANDTTAMSMILDFNMGRWLAEKNFANWCEMIVRAWCRRQLVKLAAKTTQDAMAFDTEFTEVCRQLEDSIKQLRVQGVQSQVETAESIIERVMMVAESANGLATGFNELDYLLVGGGFQPDDLVICAARPSQGKTTLSLQIVANICERGLGVLWFPLEMTSEQLIRRLANMKAGITVDDTRMGYTEEQRRRRNQAFVEIASWNLHFGKQARINNAQVWEQTALLNGRLEKGIDLVVVDQLGLMNADRRIDNRPSEVAYLSREMKLLANEMKIPVLCPHQMSREGQKESKGKRMGLEHLRGSDAVGQDADTVLIIQEKEDETLTSYAVEVTVAKQRKGAVGSAQFDFDRMRGTFAERMSSASTGLMASRKLRFNDNLPLGGDSDKDKEDW